MAITMNRFASVTFCGYTTDMVMGRPKLAKSQLRRKPLRIRLTTAERARLDRAAKARGKHTATWARDILLSVVDGKNADAD